MRSVKRENTVLLSLLALSFVPCFGGLLRLIELGSNTAFMPANSRVELAPTPAIIHIISSAIFCILGAFQLTKRNGFLVPNWHKYLGYILIIGGVFSALSGLWMTHYYTFNRELQGPILYGVRLIVAASMLGAIALSVLAVLKHDFQRHHAWIIRAYALAQGAGTQFVVAIPWLAMGEEPEGISRDLLMSFAWILNIYIAERVIIRSRKVSEPTQMLRHRAHSLLNDAE